MVGVYDVMTAKGYGYRTSWGGEDHGLHPPREAANEGGKRKFTTLLPVLFILLLTSIKNSF